MLDSLPAVVLRRRVGRWTFPVLLWPDEPCTLHAFKFGRLPKKSRPSDSRHRSPADRPLRDLVLTYFPIDFTPRGEPTLRRYSRPANLARFDRLDWITSEKPIWFIAEYLCDIPHFRLLKPGLEKHLTRVDR